MGKQINKHTFDLTHSSYRAPSTPKNTFLDLKHGKIPVSKTINVRGMTVEEALDSIETLFKHTVKQTNVLVIHGKGLRSHQQEPMLKKSIQTLCYQHPQILAYCQALSSDGGSGATYLLVTHIITHN